MLLSTPYFISAKKLFTPGPLGVSMTTKQAMLRDLGSRDVEFIAVVRHIRESLVELAGAHTSHFFTLTSCYCTKPLQIQA